MIRWIKIVRTKGIKKNSMLVGHEYLPFIASRLVVCLGLDPDYVEFLKLKKQKAVEAQSAMSEEQMQSRFLSFCHDRSSVNPTLFFSVHHALEEMKKSLSFISSKLVTKESRGNLGQSLELSMINRLPSFWIDGTEINHLQDRLASTEAQMCKILTALDAASDKVNKLTKKPAKVPAKVPASESDDSAEEDDNVLPSNEPLHDSSSDDDEVEAEDPTNMDDEEGEGQATYDRDRSLSPSSNPSSADDDQSAPTAELNRLIRRKRHWTCSVSCLSFKSIFNLCLVIVSFQIAASSILKSHVYCFRNSLYFRYGESWRISTRTFVYLVPMIMFTRTSVCTPSTIRNRKVAFSFVCPPFMD